MGAPSVIQVTCTFPDCDRQPVALGLCAGHYRQQLRGKPLRPLRTGPAKQTVALRLSPEAAEAVRDDYAGAVEALERWAKRR